MRTRPPQLVELVDYDGPYSGSFIPMLRASLDAAQRRAWPTRVIASEAAARQPWFPSLADRYEVATVDCEQWRTAARALRGIIGEHAGPSILHSHFTGFEMASAIVGARDRDAVVAWHVHSHLEDDPRVRIANMVKFVTAGRAVDVALCVGPSIVAGMRRRGMPRRALEYFPNAIDVDRFELVEPDERARARADLGLRDDALVILHFGWDWLRKGGDLMLDAFTRLDGDPVLLIAAGSDEARRAAAAQSGDVRVLEPRENVRTLYAAADLFASPSRAEGMPFGVAEAIASGLAVVASDLPGQVTLCEGLDSCEIVPLDAAALTGALARLAGPGRLSREQRADARSRLSRDHGLRPWSERLIERLATELPSGAAAP